MSQSVPGAFWRLKDFHIGNKNSPIMLKIFTLFVTCAFYFKHLEGHEEGDKEREGKDDSYVAQWNHKDLSSNLA